jgi:hypothetical protein
MGGIEREQTRGQQSALSSFEEAKGRERTEKERGGEFLELLFYV